MNLRQVATFIGNAVYALACLLAIAAAIFTFAMANNSHFPWVIWLPVPPLLWGAGFMIRSVLSRKNGAKGTQHIEKSNNCD